MRTLVALAALTLVSQQPSTPVPAPVVDHHQHFFSVAAIGLGRGSAIELLDASALVAYLNAAGIQRAAVLSSAYQFGNPNRPALEDEYARVKAENDWTSRQVAQFPTRLRGLCGVNPLKAYALEEIARCAQDPSLRSGLKLHFGNSDVDLDNPAHVQQLVRVFRAASDRRMAVVVHMRSSVTMRRAYGAKEAAVFLREVLPAAPQIPVQIAHLAGGGTYDDPATDEALSVFVEAIARKNPAMERVYFDISGIAGYGKWMDHADQVAMRVRQLGLQRILFGSDLARGGGLVPRDAWASVMKLPLSGEELRTIAGNVAPYMR